MEEKSLSWEFLEDKFETSWSEVCLGWGPLLRSRVRADCSTLDTLIGLAVKFEVMMTGELTKRYYM